MDKMVQNAWIIDDDEIYKYGFRRFVTIKHLCANICGFCNGKEAIDFLTDIKNEAELPDVIFLDIDMPVMNGWDFMAAYRKASVNKKVRIVMVTSSLDYEEYRRAREFPEITDYITKPIDSQQFSSVFNAA